MSVLFVCLAVGLLAIYSPYLYRLVAGKGRIFEELLQEKSNELRDSHDSGSRRVLTLSIMLALVFEAGYFISAWYSVSLLTYRCLTLVFAAFEVFHVSRTLLNINPFLSGKIPVARFVNWRLERIAALGFAFHAVVGMLLLIL